MKTQYKTVAICQMTDLNMALSKISRSAKKQKKILEFLRTLTNEIELISKMIEGNERFPGKEDVVIRNGNIIGGSKILDYFKPIDRIVVGQELESWIGTKTNKGRNSATILPRNKVIVDYGKGKIKAVFASPNPMAKINGNYMNSNGYANFSCAIQNTKLLPGETKSIGAILIFSHSVEELQSAFKKWRHLVRF